MLGDAITSATTAVSSTVKSVTSSVASAVSGVTDSLSKLFGSSSSFIKQISVPQMPIPNQLHDYATYNYVLGLGCLSKEQMNDPDNTYKKGQSVRLICKSANAEPENRVLTAYGKFNFFIENMEINNLVGFGFGTNTAIIQLSFDIIEPYSMGLFLTSCQQITQELKHNNFREAPFLLTIEFRGNTETGQIVNIPNTKRQYPIKITDIEMTVNEEGCKYHCEAMGIHLIGRTDTYSTLKSDASVKGKTVQEVLQTGEKSLQAVINQRFKQYVDQGLREVPDEIIILFPENVATAVSEPNSQTKETKDSATTSASSTGGSQSVYQKLGVSRSGKNSTLVQQEGACNAIGKANLGFSESRKGDAPIGKDNVIWDSDNQVNVRGNNTIDTKESDFRFSQSTDIANAINQVILNSDFIKQSLDASMISSTGMKGIWSIETQTYYMGEVEKSTGQCPKLIVYRVVPYKAHTSNLMPPNTKAPGFEELKKQAAKEYNYIYTGKNIDIKDFKIVFNTGFVSIMSADSGNKSMDVKTSSQTSRSAEPITTLNPLSGGQLPPNQLGATPTQVDYSSTNTKTDKKGGGGTETPSIRAARLFMDAVTKDADLYELELTILGDPYYLVDSGVGNYTSAPSQYDNLNADGTMNYQNGEVDIIVNFRTPIDINDSTGLYNFTGMDPTAPVMQYSGLYKVTEVTSKFVGGEFYQILTGFRRATQEYESTADPSTMFNTSTAAPSTSADLIWDP